jgi:hypothetical protein
MNIDETTLRIVRKKYTTGRKKSSRSQKKETTTEDKDYGDTSDEENDGEANVIVPL